MGEISSLSVKNICAIVDERDKIVLDKIIKIKYYNNCLENIFTEIKFLEAATRKIEDKLESFGKQMEHLEQVRKSLSKYQIVGMQSLINHKCFDNMVASILKMHEVEKRVFENGCSEIYRETKEKLYKNSLCQDLEKEEVDYLKYDFKKKDYETKIKLRNERRIQRVQIQKQLFYIFCISIAERFVNEKQLRNLQKLKDKEIDSIKKLYILQETVKMRQKLGAPKEKMRTRVNISFGSQESNLKLSLNRVDKTGLLPQQEESGIFNEKLNKMFHQDEIKLAESSPKVKILSQKVVIPSFVAASPKISEKRKISFGDISRKWQKIMDKTSFSQIPAHSASPKKSEVSKDCKPTQIPQFNLIKERLQTDSLRKSRSIDKIPSENISDSGFVKANTIPPENLISNTRFVKPNTIHPETLSLNTGFVKPNIPEPSCEVIHKNDVSRASNKTVRFKLENMNQRIQESNLYENVFRLCPNPNSLQNTVEMNTSHNTDIYNIFSVNESEDNNYASGSEYNPEYKDIDAKNSDDDSGKLNTQSDIQPFENTSVFFNFGKNIFTPF